MAKGTKNLARLVRLQSQINRAGRSKLVLKTAENKKLETEREHLDSIIGGENLTTRLYPQIALQRMAKLVELETRGAAEVDQLAGDVSAGKQKMELLQERLAKSLADDESEKSELEFLERLSILSKGR